MDIYSIKLHETIIVSDRGDLFITAIRVPGGWIYNSFDKSHNIMGSAFIPYCNEFQETKENSSKSYGLRKSK